MASNLHQISIYTDLRVDPFLMQPRLSKVTVYLVSTMALLFSFAFIFSKKQPKRLCPKDSIRKEGSLWAVRFKQFNYWLPVGGGRWRVSWVGLKGNTDP